MVLTGDKALSTYDWAGDTLGKRLVGKMALSSGNHRVMGFYFRLFFSQSIFHFSFPIPYFSVT